MKTAKVTMFIESPEGVTSKARLPYAVAWAAAQGIAIYTHHRVELQGAKGRALFAGDASGEVVWNDGTRDRFASTTRVSIS